MFERAKFLSGGDGREGEGEGKGYVDYSESFESQCYAMESRGHFQTCFGPREGRLVASLHLS